MFKAVLEVFVIVMFVSNFAGAESLSGQKTITLLEQDGAQRNVGLVQFSQAEDGYTYSLTWDSEIFADHFLSMRPFKCLEGDDKHWCHVPYPYENRRRISSHDLTDLEYDLLFLWKGSSDYGINMWNGVYYELSFDGQRITGILREMDMGVLSAPPASGDLRPITADDLHEADPGSHWLPKLVIE